MHIIKTTPSVITTVCTTIKTTKCSSWVVQIHKWQIQNGEWPPSWKSKICTRLYI